MADPLVRAPRLPAAPVEYDQRFFDQLIGILRLYFNKLDNPGSVLASTQTVNGVIVSGLSFSKTDPTTPGTIIVSLPTEADLSNLKVGDVYYDTTADNVLKVKV